MAENTQMTKSKRLLPKPLRGILADEELVAYGKRGNTGQKKINNAVTALRRPRGDR